MTGVTSKGEMLKRFVAPSEVFSEYKKLNAMVEK